VKRDGRKCCVTGRPGRLWDPLVVAPILPIPTGWVTDKVGFCLSLLVSSDKL
jgi:hypothetical protein